MRSLLFLLTERGWIVSHLSSYANDPERIEEQANRMAEEGWLLEKFGSLVSTYRRGKAGEYEYRVQVKEAGIDRLTYVAELAEFGIEEVGGVGDLIILRKRADGTPFELYSDLDSEIAALEKRRSHARNMMLGALVLVLLRGNYAYKAISQYGFSNWLDTQLDSPVYMVLTILIVAGLLAGGIASMISVRREGKKIEELKRRRMIEE